MKLTDLNLDAISYICKHLNLIDLTMLSRTCSSLRMLYPDIEIKQYSRMLKVIADINSIKYEVKNCHSTKSARTFGDVIVKYKQYRRFGYSAAPVDKTGLIINYKFASDNTRDDDECIFGGEYHGIEMRRRFNIKIDRKMWYIEYDNYGNGKVYLYRRRFPSSVSIYVTAKGRTQLIDIADRVIEFVDCADLEMDRLYSIFDPKYLPLWADKPPA